VSCAVSRGVAGRRHHHGGLIFGLSRRAATEMSFFLAIPTMLAATVFDVYQSRDILSADDLPVFAVGFVSAFVFAMLAVKACCASSRTTASTPSPGTGSSSD